MQPSVQHPESSPFTIAAQLLSARSTDTARVSLSRVSEPAALETTIAEDAQSTALGVPDSAERQGRIAQRAHELFVARGMADGHDLEDWLEAERQIDAEVRVDHL